MPSKVFLTCGAKVKEVKISIGVARMAMQYIVNTGTIKFKMYFDGEFWAPNRSGKVDEKIPQVKWGPYK